MKLSFITSQLYGKYDVTGDGDPDITGVTADSRRVRPGRVFVALKGSKQDGRAFIAEAVEKGAVAVVTDSALDAKPEGIPVIKVENAAATLGRIADVLYAKPSFGMKVVGTTGTNGKTTVTFLVHHLMKCALGRAGMISTPGYDDGERVWQSSRTTPASNEIHALMAVMKDNDCRGVAMEVSSHGLEQMRVASVRFDVGVFTNLTRDHLDYHGSMEAYFQAKARLPLILAEQRATGGKEGVFVVNTDDIHGQLLARDFASRVRILSYGFGAGADLRATRPRLAADGSRFALTVKGREILVQIPLIGRFNIYNAMAALGAAASIGLNFREAVRNLADAPQIPGRMQSVTDRAPFRVFVDYAHTPDALENALDTLRELKPARLITVFGCGGERDRMKRPQMGRCASERSDIVLVTSDNPRGENPAAILKEIEGGISRRNYRVIEDRAEAIRVAIETARENDLVLIAGKGHETTQEIAGEKHPFDDVAVAREALRQLPPERGGGS